MNTIQIERQRDLLQSIVLDISDIEQLAFGSSIDLESKQQLLGEKLCQIRQTATAGLFDEHINAVILDGYKSDCLDSLMGFLDLSNSIMDETVTGLTTEATDTQLQLLAMAATSYVERFAKYLQLKEGLVRQSQGVDNG